VRRRDRDRLVFAVVVAIVPQVGQITRAADWGRTTENIVDELLMAYITTVSCCDFGPTVLSARHTRNPTLNEGREAKGDHENESREHLDVNERVKIL